MPRIKGVFYRPKNVESSPIGRDMMQHIRRNFPINNKEVEVTPEYDKYFDALSVAEGSSPQLKRDAKDIMAALRNHGTLIFFQRELTPEERAARRQANAAQEEESDAG